MLLRQDESEGLANSLREAREQIFNINYQLEESKTTINSQKQRIEYQQQQIQELQLRPSAPIDTSAPPPPEKTTEEAPVKVDEEPIPAPPPSEVTTTPFDDSAPPPPPNPLDDAPPPPPGMDAPPPPPGPPMLSKGKPQPLVIPGIKEANVPMKSVNWATIPQRLIKNTVFANMDLTQLNLDFDHIESVFCSKPVVLETKKLVPISKHTNSHNKKGRKQTKTSLFNRTKTTTKCSDFPQYF